MEPIQDDLSDDSQMPVPLTEMQLILQEIQRTNQALQTVTQTVASVQAIVASQGQELSARIDSVLIVANAAEQEAESNSRRESTDRRHSFLAPPGSGLPQTPYFTRPPETPMRIATTERLVQVTQAVIPFTRNLYTLDLHNVIGFFEEFDIFEKTHGAMHSMSKNVVLSVVEQIIALHMSYNTQARGANQLSVPKFLGNASNVHCDPAEILAQNLATRKYITFCIVPRSTGDFMTTIKQISVMYTIDPVDIMGPEGPLLLKLNAYLGAVVAYYNKFLDIMTFVMDQLPNKTTVNIHVPHVIHNKDRDGAPQEPDIFQVVIRQTLMPVKSSRQGTEYVEKTLRGLRTSFLQITKESYPNLKTEQSGIYEVLPILLELARDTFKALQVRAQTSIQAMQDSLQWTPSNQQGYLVLLRKHNPKEASQLASALPRNFTRGDSRGYLEDHSGRAEREDTRKAPTTKKYYGAMNSSNTFRKSPPPSGGAIGFKKTHFASMETEPRMHSGYEDDEEEGEEQPYPEDFHDEEGEEGGKEGAADEKFDGSPDDHSTDSTEEERDDKLRDFEASESTLNAIQTLQRNQNRPPKAPMTAAEKKLRPCYKLQEGECTAGRNCDFSHDVAVNMESINLNRKKLDDREKRVKQMLRHSETRPSGNNAASGPPRQLRASYDSDDRGHQSKHH